MEKTEEAVSFPVTRTHTFDPPEELRKLREERPLTRMQYRGGHLGWLATSYSVTRAMLSDNRFSVRAGLNRSPLHDIPSDDRMLEPGFFITQDPPEHTRYRKLLAGEFTVRRVKQFQPRISEITEHQLDELAAQPQPADLVAALAEPIPSLVICEVLGVPYENQHGFQSAAAVLFRMDAAPEEYEVAITTLRQLISDVVARKRVEPGDDLISRLLATGELSESEFVNISFLLLLAGHETTAQMLSLGTYALLRNPEQLELLRRSPELMNNAIEELLRYLSIAHIGPVRTALEDVELAGHLVRAGESVTASLPAANRDPGQFADPDALDITRSTSGHVGFGHGVHQCIGQQLARLVMRTVYSALFERFPNLRVAAPAEEIMMREYGAMYGLYQLPVTW